VPTSPLTSVELTLLADWKRASGPLAAHEYAARIYGRGGAVLVRKGPLGTVLSSEVAIVGEGAVLTVWKSSAAFWDDGNRIEKADNASLLQVLPSLLSDRIVVMYRR
jgi:hypothetical protein